MENISDPNFKRPSGWQKMPLWDRMGWLRRQGVAADLLEAMEVLKLAGEWPSEEELGMAGGRVLSPVREVALVREVVPAVIVTDSPSRAEAISRERLRPEPPGGRGDRLKGYY